MVDVVGEKHQQRRVMVVALFTGDLVNTNSRKIFTGLLFRKDLLRRLILPEGVQNYYHKCSMETKQLSFV
jgi:hypothetical protein